MKTNGNIKRYLQLNTKYVKDAEECLTKDDYVQASEKSWGAFATILKAIAAQRKKTIKTHEGLSFFTAEIARELKDQGINGTGLVADGLHQNFYENNQHPVAVKKGAKIIKQFVTRMHNRFKFDKL